MNVPGYRLLAPLGRGGMASVFRAVGPRGEVALKVIRSADPDALARFEREARLHATLGEVDGVVPLLDAGTTAEGAFLAMPLLAGGTLAERLRAGPLPVEEAVALARTLARALAAIHGAGIVHRDLKPANVLFRDPKTPLVADLGLAKLFDAAASRSGSLSGTGMFAGTIGYMAPEQIDDARAATPRSDVFSLGAIVFECIAGRRPFEGADVLSYVKAVRAGRAPRLAAVAPAPAWLDAVLARALATDPAERFADGAALLAALETGAKSGAKAPSAARSRASLALGAGGVLAIVLAVRFFASGPSEPRRAPPPPSRVAPIATSTAAQALALNVHGATLVEKKDLRGALADFSRSIALDPTNANAWANRSFVNRRLGELAAALSDAHQAVDRAPFSAHALLQLAEALRETGRPGDALAALATALEMEPGSLLLLTARACARGASKDVKGARADVDLVLERSDAYAEAWAVRANLLATDGDVEGAERAIQRALAADPDCDGAYVARSRLSILRDDLKAAVADLTSAIAIRPAGGALFARANGHERLGDLERARLDYEAAYAHATATMTRVSALLGLGRVEAQLGRRADARARFDAALEIEPRNPEALLYRAQLRFEKDPAGALADAEAGLPGAPEHIAKELREVQQAARKLISAPRRGK